MKFTGYSATVALLASSAIAAPVVTKRQAAITDADILQYALTVSCPNFRTLFPCDPYQCQGLCVDYVFL